MNALSTLLQRSIQTTALVHIFCGTNSCALSSTSEKVVRGGAIKNRLYAFIRVLVVAACVVLVISARLRQTCQTVRKWLKCDNLEETMTEPALQVLSQQNIVEVILSHVHSVKAKTRLRRVSRVFRYAKRAILHLARCFSLQQCLGNTCCLVQNVSDMSHRSYRVRLCQSCAYQWRSNQSRTLGNSARDAS